MFIANMTIKAGEAPPFSEQVDFKFDEHVNVFVGSNAVGKSTVLELVLRGYQAPDISEPELSYIDGQPVYLIRNEHCGFALEDHHDAWVHDNDWFNVIVIPAARMPYSIYHDDIVTGSEAKVYYGGSSVREPFYERDIHNAISALYRIIEGKSTEGMRLTEEYPLESIWQHTDSLEQAKNDPQKAGRGLNEALDVGHSCAKYICHEIIRGNAALNEQIVKEVKSESGLPTLEASLELGLRVQTNDKGVPALDIAALSAGTEGTIWWTRLIALSLLLMNKFEPGWRDRSAILLIDEIENHLHPTWQRRVIPALLEHFPGLQIFATTHSPFVVAGRKKGQVHMLKRDADGVVTASTNEHDIIGWTTDEILRTFMEVDEPTDQQTIDRANRLRELRGKGTLSDAERDEMDELRRQVNEDFMSSSTPLEAQRERYGEMMLDFLRSRQSELSQDGS